MSPLMYCLPGAMSTPHRNDRSMYLIPTCYYWIIDYVLQPCHTTVLVLMKVRLYMHNTNIDTTSVKGLAAYRWERVYDYT